MLLIGSPDDYSNRPRIQKGCNGVKRILIIEKFSNLRSRFIKMLSGIETIEMIATADTMETALKRNKNTDPDAVLFRIQFTREDELEKIKYLRTAFPNVFLIILSMHVTFDIRKKAIDAGADVVFELTNEFDHVEKFIREMQGSVV
jgi:DNA-binding NarL/FixJ family response regulator